MNEETASKVLLVGSVVIGYAVAVVTMELWGGMYWFIPNGFYPQHRGVPVFRVFYETVFVGVSVFAAAVIYRRIYKLNSVEDRVPSDLV